MKKVRYAICGYGHRGYLLGNLLKNPEFNAEVIAVIEPDADRVAKAKAEHNLSEENIFSNVDDFCKREKFVDAVINTTQDRMHLYTALAILNKGYNMLIEKPVGVTLEECQKIHDLAEEKKAIVGVCHSLRFHALYHTLKKILDEGKVGRLITLDQTEGVSNLHYAHSYIRGHWGNEEKSSFMLLAKSCHDMDVISYLVGKPCKRVSSFGGQDYFNIKNKPEGAPKYCLDGCPHEENCPYSARKVYLDGTRSRYVFKKDDKESVYGYIKDGPYGRCVYQCDNTVVDHQVVNLEFEGGVTATFNMNPFFQPGRYIRLGCTNASVYGSYKDRTITIHYFDTGVTDTMQLPPPVHQNHGGGDALLLENFTKAIALNKPEMILTGMDETLISHKITFAAEQSRKEGRIVEL